MPIRATSESGKQLFLEDINKGFERQDIRASNFKGTVI